MRSKYLGFIHESTILGGDIDEHFTSRRTLDESKIRT